MIELQRKNPLDPWYVHGDGIGDDTAAFQAAADYLDPLAPPGFEGDDVIVPLGLFKLVATAGKAALKITLRNTAFVGMGGPQRGGSHIVVEGSGGALDCGILIERGAGSAAADASVLRNLTIKGGSVKPIDLIVIHAHKVSISDCVIRDCLRYGVLIESGTNSPGGGLLGVCEAPAGSYHPPDFWRLDNLELMYCGDKANGGGDLTKGAAVYVHGSDTNGGCAYGLTAMQTNVAFADHSLGGCVWIACYSQQANVGYDIGLGAAIPLGCGSEDVLHAAVVQLGSAAMPVGGALSVDPAFAHRVSPTSSRLSFSRKGGASDPTNTYGAEIPGDDALLGFSRSRTGFAEKWEIKYRTPTTGLYPYQKGLFGFKLTHNGLAQNADGIGFTGAENARGKGLAAFGNPVINSRRRWSMARTYTLPVGASTVYVNPGATPFVPYPTGWDFLDDGKTEFSKANTRVSLDLEYADVASLEAGDVRVLGYAFLNSAGGGGRNCAARLLNAGAVSVTVTVVWHFEAYVMNYDTLA
jgi:hypothetical protein